MSRWKSAARALVGGLSRASGQLRRAERTLEKGLTVLCYHRVLPAEAKARYFLPDLVVTPDTFRQHCRWLSARFEVLSLSAALAKADGARRERPLAAITFDDGYRDNFVHAAPILAEAGLPATFYVVTGLIGSDAAPWYDRVGAAAGALLRTGRAVSVPGANGSVATPRDAVAAAKRLDSPDRQTLVTRLEREAGSTAVGSDADLIMNWDQLRSLSSAGHEIGSHSVSHEILPGLDDDTLAAELEGSRGTLEEGLGVPVTSFCYPNGDHDARVAARVQSAGYASAASTRNGANLPPFEPYRLRRVFVHEGRLTGPGGQPSETAFRIEVAGIADRLYRRAGSRAP